GAYPLAVLNAHGRTSFSRSLLPVTGANLGDLLLRSFIAGINLGRAEQFRERSLFVAGSKQIAALCHMHRGVGEAEPVKRRPERLVLRRHRKRLLIVLKGSINVFARFGGLSPLVKGAGRLGCDGCRTCAQERKDSD